MFYGKMESNVFDVIAELFVSKKKRKKMVKNVMRKAKRLQNDDDYDEMKVKDVILAVCKRYLRRLPQEKEFVENEADVSNVCEYFSDGECYEDEGSFEEHAIDIFRHNMIRLSGSFYNYHIVRLLESVKERDDESLFRLRIVKMFGRNLKYNLSYFDMYHERWDVVSVKDMLIVIMIVEPWYFECYGIKNQVEDFSSFKTFSDYKDGGNKLVLSSDHEARVRLFRDYEEENRKKGKRVDYVSFIVYKDCDIEGFVRDGHVYDRFVLLDDMVKEEYWGLFVQYSEKYLI